MDMIKACFEEYKIEFTRKLETVGFTEQQARVFLPETISGISGLTENSYIAEKMVDLLSTDSTALLAALNVAAISKKAGIKPELTLSGLKAITPLLNRVLSDKSDHMVGAAATLAWGSDHLMGSKKYFC